MILIIIKKNKRMNTTAAAIKPPIKANRVSRKVKISITTAANKASKTMTKQIIDMTFAAFIFLDGADIANSSGI